MSTHWKAIVWFMVLSLASVVVGSMVSPLSGVIVLLVLATLWYLVANAWMRPKGPDGDSNPVDEESDGTPRSAS